MNNDQAVDTSNTVEKYLKGMKGFFPFIERISKKKPSQLLAFLKCVIVIFSLVGLDFVRFNFLNNTVIDTTLF